MNWTLRAPPRRWRLGLALLAMLGGPTWAAGPSTQWRLELRWVAWVQGAPSSSADALSSSQGQGVGSNTWGTQTPRGSVEPLGAVLRVQSGEPARWSFGPDPSAGAASTAWALVQTPVGAVSAPVPWQPPETERGWWLQAQVDAGARSDRLRLRLQWQGARDGALATTLEVTPGRWATVATRTEGGAVPAEPGVLSSSAATPSRTRELQVRVSPVLE